MKNRALCGLNSNELIACLQFPNSILPQLLSYLPPQPNCACHAGREVTQIRRDAVFTETGSEEDDECDEEEDEQLKKSCHPWLSFDGRFCREGKSVSVRQRCLHWRKMRSHGRRFETRSNNSREVVWWSHR